jgi:hypothetical protein
MPAATAGVYIAGVPDRMVNYTPDYHGLFGRGATRRCKTQGHGSHCGPTGPSRAGLQILVLLNY